MRTTFVNEVEVVADEKIGVNDFSIFTDAPIDTSTLTNESSEVLDLVQYVSEHQTIGNFLTRVARADGFVADFVVQFCRTYRATGSYDKFASTGTDFRLLRSYKLLKYCYNRALSVIETEEPIDLALQLPPMLQHVIVRKKEHLGKDFYLYEYERSLYSPSLKRRR